MPPKMIFFMFIITRMRVKINRKNRFAPIFLIFGELHIQRRLSLDNIPIKKAVFYPVHTVFYSSAKTKNKVCLDIKSAIYII